MNKFLLPLILILFTLNSFSQNNGYNKLSANLDGVGNQKAGQFTVFCNMDVNFADGRISRYLQNSKFAMTIDDSSVKFSAKNLSMRYVPRVSSKTEYIDIKYTFERKKGYDSYYETEDGLTSIIKKVEISGSPELILDLFINYWNYKINPEDNKVGEIAHYNVMGDHISLKSITLEKSKIEITPKGFDYKESFSLNVPIN